MKQGRNSVTLYSKDEDLVEFQMCVLADLIPDPESENYLMYIYTLLLIYSNTH